MKPVRDDIESGIDAAFTTYLSDREIKVTSTMETALTNAVTRWLNQHQTQVLGGIHAQPTTELAELNQILRDAGIEYPLGLAGVRELVRQRNGHLEWAQESAAELKALRAPVPA